MSDYNVLKEYYVRYLRDIRGAKESTINHYLGALNTISKYLRDNGKIENVIYEIANLGELEIIKEYLFTQPDFLAKDQRGNQMYSAGMNNYIRFAKGEEFSSIREHIEQLDIEVPVASQTRVNSSRWLRNEIVKKQAMEYADYQCEVDSRHETFVSAATMKPYMEGHHAIPLQHQPVFSVSLDVYANIVCLCPVCHRMLHYGIKNDKMVVLNSLYNERADRLAKSGIRLSKDEFVENAI